MKMSNEQIEGERRSGRVAGIIGLLGVVLFIAIGATSLASEFRAADGSADSLAAFPDERSQVLVLLIVQAVGVLLFIPALLALFSAARRRTSVVRPGLIGLCIAGPLFFAASLIANYFAIDAAAGAFDPSAVDPGTDLDDAARDVYLDQGESNVKNGLEFAGRLGLTFAMVYTSLHAMRSGLLTRFWGTLGMALGVGVILIGPPALLAFFLAISLIIAGFWPGGRPPAWDAGAALPWPKPGEQAVVPEPEEELARPEDFEGDEGEGSSGSGSTALSAQRPARRDNKRKRKRKQRS